MSAPGDSGGDLGLVVVVAIRIAGEVDEGMLKGGDQLLRGAVSSLGPAMFQGGALVRVDIASPRYCRGADQAPSRDSSPAVPERLCSHLSGQEALR
jgi:hypothetical protein